MNTRNLVDLAEELNEMLVFAGVDGEPVGWFVVTPLYGGGCGVAFETVRPSWDTENDERPLLDPDDYDGDMIPVREYLLDETERLASQLLEFVRLGREGKKEEDDGKDEC